MKNLYIILICLFTIGNLSAQELSKEEKKELLKQIKDLKKNPEKLDKLKENVEVRNLTIEQQTEEINVLKNNLQSRNLKIASLSDSLSAVQAKLAESKSKASNAFNPETYVPGDAPLDDEGYKYRIQIGLFKNFNITHLFDQPKYIVHEDVDGLHRYSIGNFESEEDAEAFKLEMRRLGIKDAFVTTYKDGIRTTDVQPRPQQEVQKVVIQPEPAKNAFNVKSSAPAAPVRVNTNIESNPFPVQNGQVISSEPVKINTKQLNDEIIKKQEEQKSPNSTGIKINVAP